MKTIQEQIEVMQGFADGHDVFFKHRNEHREGLHGVIAVDPHWNWADYDYALAPVRKTVTRWVNCYADNDLAMYSTKRQANLYAGRRREACTPIRISWTLGEGLDDE